MYLVKIFLANYEAFWGLVLKCKKNQKILKMLLKCGGRLFTIVGYMSLKKHLRKMAFSGFCLYDTQYPVIFINNSMSYSRQIFTLFHELCHIIIKTSGIDKANDDFLNRLDKGKKELEVICNKFAGEFLVPTEDILEQIAQLKLNDSTIEMLSKKYNVSRDVILRKLLDLEKISKELYENKHIELLNEIYRKPINSSGGNYYNSKRSYLGENYIADVCRNYYSGKINIYETANYLNVKVEAIPQLGVITREGRR